VAKRLAPALRRLDAMGLLKKARVARLDLASFRDMLIPVAAQGIGTDAIRELERARPAAEDELVNALDRLSAALLESPSPRHEWPKLEGVLGLEMLARLVGVSESSARRYATGARATPPSVADRVHFLALVVGDLAGAYNELGVRAWFERRRKLLDGKAPAQLLEGDWQPEDDGAARVRDLAESLSASPAT